MIHFIVTKKPDILVLLCQNLGNCTSDEINEARKIHKKQENQSSSWVDLLAEFKTRLWPKCVRHKFNPPKCICDLREVIQANPIIWSINVVNRRWQIAYGKSNKSWLIKAELLAGGNKLAVETSRPQPELQNSEGLVRLIFFFSFSSADDVNNSKQKPHFRLQA